LIHPIEKTARKEGIWLILIIFVLTTQQNEDIRCPAGRLLHGTVNGPVQ
jgi:hypothetical protein